MNMNNKFKEVFNQIRAEEELKSKTREFLAKKTRGYTGTKTKKHGYHIYAAVCACFLCMLFGGYWLYFTPIAEISIDINPSIELSVNRFDQVIFVTGYNEDGQALSNTLNVKYKTYTDAIEQILNNEAIVALLSDNEIMTITVTGPEGLQSAHMLSQVEACTAEQRNTYCYFASSEEVDVAHEMGLSCGKYRAFLELQLLDPTITPEKVQEMTMREIRELMNDFSADCEDDSSSYDNCEHGHHGPGCGHGGGRRNKRTK